MATLKNKHTKIMQVVHCMDIAGGEKVVYSIIRNLDRERFSFSVCCLDYIGELGKRLIEEGFEVISLDRKPGTDFSLIGRLARILKDQKIDVVHAHQYTPYFYGATAGILSSQRPKIIFTEHGRHQPDCFRFKRAIYNQFLNFFTNAITGVSKFSKDSLVRYEKLPAKKIKVIYNGIDAGRFDIQINRDAKKRELGLNPNDVVIGMAGGFRPVKNHKMLLRAFHEIVKDIDNVKLVLIGEGQLRAECEVLAKELGIYNNVKFLGLRNDIPELLQTLDIFVLSSIAEASSLTLLEAMAAGLPVVVRDAGGNPEIVLKEKTGILVPSEDPREFAKAIISLIQDPAKRRRMGEAGKIRVKSLFTTDMMLKEYEKLYMGLIESKKIVGQV